MENGHAETWLWLGPADGEGAGLKQWLCGRGHRGGWGWV